MECKNCGTVNDPDGKFCKECGAKLESGNKASAPGSDSNLRIGELIYAAYQYKEAGKAEDAMLACQGAIALKPDNPQAHSLLASLYELKGDLSSAASEYELVIALNPDAMAEKATLEVLRMRLKASEREPGFFQTWLGRCAEHRPKIAAAAVFVVILVTGSIWVRSTGRQQEVTSVVPPVSAVQPSSTLIVPPVQTDTGVPEAAAGTPSPNAAQPQAAETPAETPAPPNPQAVPASQTFPHEQPQGQIVKPKVQQSPGLAAKVSKLFIRPVQPESQVVRHAVGNDSTPVIVPVDDAPVRRAQAQSEPSIVPYGSIRVRNSAPAAPAPKPAPNLSPEDKAYQLQDQGRYEDAISSYRQALARSSDTGRLYQQIGICYKRMGKTGSATESFNHAIQSYRSQLSAGGDASDIARRIKTCEAEISAN